MAESTPTAETPNDVIEAVEPTHEVTRQQVARQRRISPITLTLVLSIAFAVVYTAFQRIGTTANADSVEYTQNLAGGFLAVGMTKDQPGFIVLSALDQEQVEVSAAQTKNSLAGTHTVVAIQTPQATTSVRLRGPQVILVSEQGDVEGYNIDWTVEEFNTLREAADCSHEAATKKHRCGTPFTDLQEAFAKWPKERVPEEVRAFVEPFKDRRKHKHEHD